MTEKFLNIYNNIKLKLKFEENRIERERDKGTCWFDPHIDQDDLIKKTLVTEMATFKTSEISKHDFQYLDAFINDLLNDKPIKIGEHGESEFIFDLSKTDKEVLKRLPKNDDDKVTAMCLNDILLKNSNGKIRWTNIFKGTYSGFMSKTKGQMAEAYICYIFNNGIDSMSLLDLSEFSDDWKQSILNSVKAINERFTNKTYSAIHIDGKIINNEIIDLNVSALGRLFSGKYNQFNEKIETNSFYNAKDNWNKADILLVKKDEINLIVSDLIKIDTFENLNAFLNTKINQNELVPISLKKLKQAGDISFYFMSENNNEDLLFTSISDVKDVYFKAEKNIDNKALDDKNASCYLCSDNGLIIQFRRQTGSQYFDNLSIEARSRNGAARAGKGVTKIKFDLGISTDEFISFENEDDFYNKMAEIGISKDSILGYFNEKFNYIAYRGFYSLFLAYKNKYGMEKTLKDFFKYAYFKCAGYDCPVKFWILK